ncbi:cold-regulated protein 27 isoform X2 [Prosopis cineraria]|uniref:cold-regulated protein 27 isoform X2 n=1 Tax=Prosopis cineraria TaxID=364024 RepID=UPI00240F7927|nr:cold-regulated protein 27 isoform X2 [Prosopis cineraria]
MRSTSHRATRTIPPALRCDSTDFTPFPPDLMQGTTEAEPLSMAVEWTNEKHSLYLKSMEASFVNQLYDSKRILGWRYHEGTSFPSTASSGQFKVLRGGSWHNINFKRENPQINRANECHDLNENPWIQHFRSSSKQGSVTSPVVEETATSKMEAAGLGQRRGIVTGLPTSSGHIHLCKSRSSQQDALCDDTEMSDQNFVDEEVEGEKESERSSNVKRLKPLESHTKYNDQLRV